MCQLHQDGLFQRYEELSILGEWLGARGEDLLLFAKPSERGVLVTLAVVAIGWTVSQLARRQAAGRADEA